jgi:hypothetical protein
MRGIQSFVVTDVKNSGGIIIRVIAPERNKLRLIEEDPSSKFDEDNDNKISQHCLECDLDLLVKCLILMIQMTHNQNKNNLKKYFFKK